MNNAGRGTRIILYIICIAVTVWILSLPPTKSSHAVENYFDLFNLSEREEGYFSVVDESDGSIILITARVLHVGNEYIDRENRLFRIVRIKDDQALARVVRQGSRPTSIMDRFMPSLFQGTNRWDSPVQAQRRRVAIYHSHGAESYVPSDGEDSIIEGGGILDVGKVFAESLEEQGIETLHSTSTHVPHDAGAYQRSRRTKEELLRQEPDVIFDVHRDAVPPEAYEETIDGRNLVQILLVVGGQNQNAANNRNFAEELKAAADERYPGLVKGILVAQGSYNQDLSPRSILIEVGAHENEREQAEESVALFADVVADYLEVAGEREGAAGPRATITGEGGIAAGAALWILVILGVAVVIYLFIAAGSWPEMQRKLRQFFHREFGDVLKGFKRK